MKGLMSFMFDHENWEKLYVKNCSLKTQAEWSAEGYANMPLGILYSGLGVLCMLTLQAMCICIEMFIAALVYVYNEFFPLPNFIEIIAQISWIGVHGDTPIVYLLLNASLRNAVFKMMKNGRVTFTTIRPSRSEAFTRESKTAPISQAELEKVPSGAVCPEEIEYKH
uniref:Uncharacterized protein n=1 Tax=Acrobeloides nanus TaxID=290746 RepID=A0A914C6X0_9BILA